MNDEKEWFAGARVDEDKLPWVERSAPYRIAAWAVVAVVALAFLVGCASTPKDGAPYLYMTCAVVETGMAQFEGSPRRFPSIKLVCEEEDQ